MYSKALIVGQLYKDTILHVDAFPEEDEKKRATDLQTRCGGNCANTSRVLAKLALAPWTYCMSSIGDNDPR
jgi:sugar/nucleoside kinase (ribokinase family)